MSVTKVMRFSVRLKNVGPLSARKLRSIGLDKDLTIATAEVEFKLKSEAEAKSPLFIAAVGEKRVEVINNTVECVVSELRRGKDETNDGNQVER